jgi:pimeloyl-ACP methyl ester carboxylesterase
MLRLRAGERWASTEEYADTAARMRSAIRIAGAAHCGLEYERWAFRSQWRPDGHRFLRAMREPITVPVLSLRGAQDRYMLDSTLRRGARLSPHRRLVTVPDAGHFAHQENPAAVTGELAKLLTE